MCTFVFYSVRKQWCAEHTNSDSTVFAHWQLTKTVAGREMKEQFMDNVRYISLHVQKHVPLSVQLDLDKNLFVHATTAWQQKHGTFCAPGCICSTLLPQRTPQTEPVSWVQMDIERERGITIKLQTARYSRIARLLLLTARLACPGALYLTHVPNYALKIM